MKTQAVKLIEIIKTGLKLPENIFFSDTQQLKELKHSMNIYR